MIEDYIVTDNYIIIDDYIIIDNYIVIDNYIMIDNNIIIYVQKDKNNNLERIMVKIVITKSNKKNV